MPTLKSGDRHNPQIFLMLTPILLQSVTSGTKGLPSVEIARNESTYTIATWIMDLVYRILDFLGLEHHQTLFLWIYAAVVFLIALGIGYVVKWITIDIVNLLGKKLKGDFYQNLTQNHFFPKVARIIPAIVFLIFIQFTFASTHTDLGKWLTRITWIYIVFIMAKSVNTFVDVMWLHFDSRENKRRLPLKGLVQLVKGIIWIIVTIISVAIIVDKSPATLLAGLGAFAAVLMLVFKDSILGVVAGVQLSENDSLHVGDWIKVHGTDANGTVTEVSLTAVKIQNWDKTITTVPPYTLVSGSFTNYRSMQISNTRRIDRSYMIDADSVVPTDDGMLAEYARIPLLKDWIEKKIDQRRNGKECNVNNPEGLADGSLDTNLGVFRAYLKLYLDSHHHISHVASDTCFVSTLAQTATGIPLQLYCFTNTSAWTQYEAIQSAVFEHVAAMLFRFHLYVFENPTGRDTIIDGYLSPGKNADVLFGLPYPMFANTGSPDNPAYPMPKSSAPEPSAMAPSDVPKEIDINKELSGSTSETNVTTPEGK